MKGVIIAAGKSPRLLPLTKHTPVSLLEVGGKAILDHQLNALSEAGVEDKLVITGYYGEQIEKFCAGKAICIFNPFYETCNVAMNLWLVREEMKGGSILVYADILFEGELVKELLTQNDSSLLVVDRRGLDKEAEKVAQQEGVVTSMGKAINEPYGEFIGIAKISQHSVQVLTEELELIARTDLEATFPQLVMRLVERNHSIKVLTSDRPWVDIDFPDDLDEANSRWPLG